MPNYSRRMKQRESEIKRKRVVGITFLLLIAAFIVYPLASTFIDSQSDNKFKFSEFSEADPELLLITTVSGLQYQDMVVGDGGVAETGDTVSVHYTGWLRDGTKFDSSVDRGTPFDFLLGAGRVIKGWDEGVAGMRVGGARLLLIPSELAYGELGQGSIPPGAELIFKVELLSVDP